MGVNRWKCQRKTEFNYDEELKLTRPQTSSGGADIEPVQFAGSYEHLGADIIASVREETIGYEGMRIDRMLFEKFEDTVRKNETIADAVMASQWDRVIDYVNREVFDKPEEYYHPQEAAPSCRRGRAQSTSVHATCFR